MLITGFHLIYDNKFRIIIFALIYNKLPVKKAWFQADKS